MSRTADGARTDYWYDATGLTLETGAFNATYLRTPGGQLLSTSSGGAVYNYARDLLGSTTALVTSCGALANTYRYDPLGQSIGTTGTTYNPFQFTGLYLDSATGLYRMTQRFYGPASGRFTQLDPLPSSILDVNRYAYAGCNPVNATDPTGLYPYTIGQACIQGAAVGLIGGAIMGTIGGVITGLYVGPGVLVTGFAGFLGGAIGGAIAGCVVDVIRFEAAQSNR